MKYSTFLIVFLNAFYSLEVLSQELMHDTTEIKIMPESLKAETSVDDTIPFRSNKEKDALTRLSSEMIYLLPLVDEAEQVANESSSQPLNYKALRQDLKNIIDELQRHVNTSEHAPKPPKHLNAKY